MEVTDLILVSVDDHLIEPPDVFVHHIAPRFKDLAAIVKRGTNGAHHCQIEGQKAPGPGLNAVAGQLNGEYGFTLVSYEQVRKGCLRIRTGGMTLKSGAGTQLSAGPFGGVKRSGYGRELGEDGLNEFTQTKLIEIRPDREAT